MNEAYRREPDAYREDIVVWHCLDQLLDHRAAPVGELTYVRKEALAGLSTYPFKLAQLLAKLESRSFEETHTELVNEYLDCKQTFRSVDCLSWRHARKLTRRFLANGLQQEGFARWRWLFKIASRI
jgi:cellulose synthase operon protein C